MTNLKIKLKTIKYEKTANKLDMGIYQYLLTKLRNMFLNSNKKNQSKNIQIEAHQAKKLLQKETTIKYQKKSKIKKFYLI